MADLLETARRACALWRATVEDDGDEWAFTAAMTELASIVQAEYAEQSKLREERDKYKAALEQVLIKVDWNSDEFSDLKQYDETRALILDALVGKVKE